MQRFVKFDIGRDALAPQFRESSFRASSQFPDLLVAASRSEQRLAEGGNAGRAVRDVRRTDRRVLAPERQVLDVREQVVHAWAHGISV